MTVLVTSDSILHERQGTFRYFEATCGKVSARVSLWPCGLINVCAMNASASIRRFPAGRSFGSASSAIEGYKSSAMRAIVTHCMELAGRAEVRQ